MLRLNLLLYALFSAVFPVALNQKPPNVTGPYAQYYGGMVPGQNHYQMPHPYAMYQNQGLNIGMPMPMPMPGVDQPIPSNVPQNPSNQMQQVANMQQNFYQKNPAQTYQYSETNPPGKNQWTGQPPAPQPVPAVPLSPPAEFPVQGLFPPIPPPPPPFYGFGPPFPPPPPMMPPFPPPFPYPPMPMLPPPPPIIPLPPPVDHYYCSAYASFALSVILDAPIARLPPINNMPPIQMPQPNIPTVSADRDDPNVGVARHPPPPTEHREFCRYIATGSPLSCAACCQAAAHYSPLIPEHVTGMLLLFDPENPPIASMSFGISARKKRQAPAATTTSTPPTPVDRRRFQCVCCAPKNLIAYRY